MKKLKTGIELLLKQKKNQLCGKQIALVCNQASVLSDFQHIIFRLLAEQEKNNFRIVSVFGPQHGLWGHTQDNMIEWEGAKDYRFPFEIYSLYGRYRFIPPDLLKGIDTIIFDIQDAGSRYYTFIWTLANVLNSISGTQIELIVTDRPNPINAIDLEGPVLEEAFQSFVGLHPLPVRHGMTIGEIAQYLHYQFYPNANLSIIPMDNYKREFYFDALKIPWVMPSPNIPTVESAVVYPGMCLLEGTNLSEGRGTTRPFEIFGAPWIDGVDLCNSLNALSLPGVYFRFIGFLPTFQKYAGQYCEGCFIHVTDRNIYKPFFSTLEILRFIISKYPDQFNWKEPPYEYEYVKKPFDILTGSSSIRKLLENCTPINEIEQSWQSGLDTFKNIRKKYLIY